MSSGWTTSLLLLSPFRTLVPLGVRLAGFGVLLAVVALSDVGRLDLPRQRRQVPQSWYADYGPVRSYGLYGLSLGAGLTSNIQYAAAYLIFLGVALLTPVSIAAASGAAFGLGRAALVGPLGCSTYLATWLDRCYVERQTGLGTLGALLGCGFGFALVQYAAF